MNTNDWKERFRAGHNTKNISDPAIDTEWVENFIEKELSQQRRELREKSPHLFYIHKNKGEMDFGVNGAVSELSYEEMRDFREMVVVGISQAEQMWKRAQESKHPASARLPDTK